MNIIGFDPGLTSPGIAWHDGNIIEADIIPVGKLRGIRRIQTIVDFLLNLQPDKIIMEGYAYGRINQMAAMGELGGCAKWEADRCGIDMVIISPTSLKKFATNKGNANKEAVRDAANRERQKAGLEWFKTSDEADAYWLLRIGMELENESPDLPKYRRDALSAIQNPVPKKKKMTKTSKSFWTKEEKGLDLFPKHP